jgi:putative intracellular protease/amidase
LITKTAYVLLRNDYADWEPASALAELRRSFGYSVQTIGLTIEPIVSMGGLRVIPDIVLSDFVPESAAILILPGGAPGWREKSWRFQKRLMP